LTWRTSSRRFADPKVRYAATREPATVARAWQGVVVVVNRIAGISLTA
jgi:hypothetical protein